MYKRLIDIIICPFCGFNRFELSENSVKCPECESVYNFKNDQIDLRLKKNKKVYLEFKLESNYSIESDFTPLRENLSPANDYSKIKTPKHLTRELLSNFPKAGTSTSLALDLGCGKGIHKQVIETAGYEYIGMDYDSANAMVLGDAHSLPFADNTFDFVLSIAVLEHIQYPFLFSSEVFRVLKKDGLFIGSVAFLEGFHSHSYYHHTHYGTYNTLSSAGFNNIRVAPNPYWHVLKAQSSRLFLHMPVKISRIITGILYCIHRLWWFLFRIVKKKVDIENKRILMFSASFHFVAKK